MLPILFIHGFGGGTYEYQPIIRFLRKNGFRRFYEFSYPERFGERPITYVAKMLEHFVAANIKESEFDIIGISQGGIIARKFIMDSRTSKVRRCITLCSPHEGSMMAYLSARPGIADLRPHSRLLESLHDHGSTEYYAVHTPFDLMVFPGTNAIFPKAVKNKRVLSILHPLAFWCKPTLGFILSALKEK